MSNHPIRLGSCPRFLDRDHRYLLLTVILSVALFMLFGTPGQHSVVTPVASPAQAAYTPLQAPVSNILNPHIPDTQQTFTTGNAATKDAIHPPVANDQMAIPGSPAIKPATVQAKPTQTPVVHDTTTPKTSVHLPVANDQMANSGNPVIKPTTVQVKQLQTPSARDINARWHRYIVRKGDTLSGIFKSLKLPQALALTLCRRHPGTLLQRLHPGRTLYWKTSTDHTLMALSYAFSIEDTLEIRKLETGYEAVISPKPVLTVQRQASGKIISSLNQATRQQHVPVSVMLQLVDIFGWDIDFGQDLRRNDSFNVLWQQDRWQGKVVRNGPVLAAEFINQGSRYRAVRFTDSHNKTGYYAPDGTSLRRSFLKTPVKFSRISSGFSLRRYHPKLKKWRAHHGVDYAAHRGTPVRSTADGTILFKGWKGGYGRTVIIRHGGPYSTVYAHLSRYSRGLRRGSHVKQGDIVAYVGSSGLATGPHLHYEFRVNGKYKNPVTFHPPRALAIPKKELLAFRNSTRRYLAKLEAEQQIRVVASR